MGVGPATTGPRGEISVGVPGSIWCRWQTRNLTDATGEPY